MNSALNTGWGHCVALLGKIPTVHVTLALPLHQAPVVERLDNFIQRISRYPADKMYWLEFMLSYI